MAPSREQAERWLSRYRYRPYLTAANDDHVAALALYEWNASVSAAFLEIFAILEVMLRNAVDQVLSPFEVPHTARLRIQDGWWFGSRTFLSEQGHNVFATTRERLPEGDKFKRDKVLAELSFGFWTGLFSKDYDELFRHHLIACFPHHPGKGFDRKSVSSRLEELRKLRNWSAHHQPVYSRPLEELHEQALDLIGWIDPDAAVWAGLVSRVPTLLAARPVPAPPLAVVVPAAQAWPLYGLVAAYVCQPRRFFQQVSHIAFYHQNQIEPEIAKILDRFDDVPWSDAEISRLRATKDPRDAALADVIRAAIAAGWTGAPSYQVFLLTPAGAPESTGHVTLPAPIPNTRSGRGSAYVQRQRYASVDALRTATTTSAIPVWR